MKKMTVAALSAAAMKRFHRTNDAAKAARREIAMAAILTVVEIDVVDIEGALEIAAAAQDANFACKRVADSPNGDIVLQIIGGRRLLQRFLKRFGYDDGIAAYAVEN